MENRLEELRHERGIKQEDLAQELGVSRQTISSLEKGRYNPSIGNLAARKAFTFMSVFMPLVALVLYVLDQVSLTAMLVIIGIEVVTFVTYAIYIARLQREM